MINQEQQTISEAIEFARQKHIKCQAPYMAKSTETKEWLYGFYVGEQAVNAHAPYIIPMKELYKNPPANWTVYEDTLCKNTGLMDKNGQPVFEWAIIKSFYDKDSPDDFVIETVFYKNNALYAFEEGIHEPHRIDENGMLIHSVVIGHTFDDNAEALLALKPSNA